MNDREMLLKKIQALSFTKVECELFLDTHPDCQAALSHYRDIVAQLDTAMSEYQNKYGPLFAEGSMGDRWTWIDGPWPWQMYESRPTPHNGCTESRKRGR